MFTRIDLQFFKCFKLLRLPLAPLTLLTGLNASGKSSVLQALALLHQTIHDHEWSTRLALNGSVVRLGSMPDVVDQEFGGNSFTIALENDGNLYDWSFEGERRDMSMRIQHVSVNGKTTKYPQELQYLLPLDEKEAAASLAQRLRNITYISAERAPPREIHRLEDPHAVTVVGPQGEHAMSILHWGGDQSVPTELVLPSSSAIRLRQVEEHMSTFFPGFKMELRQTGNSVMLGLRTSDATGFFNPIHTGFGLTQTLPIVVAALSAAKGDTVMLENPEGHLHPAGQARMGQFITAVARAGIQVLVETHSDHILNGIRRAVKENQLAADQIAIHFFRPRSEELAQVLSPNMDDFGHIDDWPAGFFDQFDKDANYFAGWGE